LLARLSGADFIEGCHTLEDTMQVAQILEQAGINALDVTTGWHEAPVPSFHASVPRGSWAYLAEGVKSVVSIPVITGTRVPDPVLADRILVEGKADLVYMARPLIADPELPNKARAGRLEEIRPCIACSRCFSTILRGEPMVCTVNARAGKETEYQLEPVKQPKKVLVIGGGPAGMEAARVAATRGHRVMLIDRQNSLGGQMQVATIPPYKEEVGYFVKYLAGQLDRLDVEVRLNQEVTVKVVAEIAPDAVIMAAGASHIIPDIPGKAGNNVATATDVLTGKREVGEKVVIIGGGRIGCETAEFLAGQGKKVTILEILDRIGNDFERTNRWVVMQRLRQAQIGLETRVEVTEITQTGVRINRDGESHFIEADSIVMAAGMKPENRLAEELKNRVPVVYIIGDCSQPRGIAEAVQDGLRVGCMI